jgi:hypothetical protein
VPSISGRVVKVFGLILVMKYFLLRSDMEGGVRPVAPRPFGA